MNGCEGGPSPSLLAAEMVTLMMVDKKQLKEEGNSMGHPLPYSQEDKPMVELNLPPIKFEP